MSIDENEDRPESAERAIQVTNCTIYVGRVGIVIDPRLNSDCTSIARTRATEDRDGSSVNTSSKQTDFVSVRSTKLRSQRQSTTTPYAARSKTTKFGLTSRQKSVCHHPATSQLPCCLHGVGRCNYEARFGAGSDNYIAGTDDCNAAARNGGLLRRNSSGRSTIWGTQNGGRLSPLRLGSRDQNFAKSNWSTPSKIPVPYLSQPKPPARQDRPVDLYVGSRLPVPVRPGPAAARILRIDRTGDVRQFVTADKLPETDDNPDDTDDKPDDTKDKPADDTDDRPEDTDDRPDDTDDKQDDKPDDNPEDNPDDKPDDTDDKPNDVVDLLDYDGTAVEPRQPCEHINESAASATSKLGYHSQALDDRSSTTGSEPAAVESDSLSDASDHWSLKSVDQDESGMTVPTLKPVIDDDDYSAI